jgi:hypothetical protein
MSRNPQTRIFSPSISVPLSLYLSLKGCNQNFPQAHGTAYTEKIQTDFKLPRIAA